MNFELGGEPIDPDEFQRAFGFSNGDNGYFVPDKHIIDGIESTGGHPTDNFPEDEQMARLPDPAELSELFDTLSAFNAAEKETPRLGLDIVDGINKGRRKEEYKAQGMTGQEATDFIKATEGEHAPEAEAALLDLAGITLRYRDTLKDFGLSVTSDMFTGSRTEIADPVKLTASLSCIHEHTLPPSVQHGLNKTLKSFTGGLWATVINTNGEQVDSYGAIPYWMKSSGYYPEPEAYAQATHTLAHGEKLATQFERLGVDPQSVHALRNVSRYYQEGMIVEWALGHEMGFDEDPYRSKDRPLYQQDHDSTYWDAYFRVLDGAEAKSQPGDTFVADQREAATLHITTYLGKILADIKAPLTQEKFNAAWPDRDALEMKIAENMHDPYIAKWVGWRNRLQQYGRQGEAQA